MRLILAVLILWLAPLIVHPMGDDMMPQKENDLPSRPEPDSRNTAASSRQNTVMLALFSPVLFNVDEADFPFLFLESEGSTQTNRIAGTLKPERPMPDPDAVPALSREELCTTIVASAQAHDLPITFFSNLIWQESRFNHKAVSPVGAQGVAQFMPEVAERVGLENPFDPREALPASARLLRELFRQFGGNAGLAAAAYNAGPKRVIDWLTKPKAKLPKETRDYVETITGQPAEKWRTRKPLPVAYTLARQMPCRQVEAFIEVQSAEQRQIMAEIAAATPPAPPAAKANARKRLLTHKSSSSRVAAADETKKTSEKKEHDKAQARGASKPSGKKERTQTTLSAARAKPRQPIKLTPQKASKNAAKPAGKTKTASPGATHASRPKG